MILYSTNEFLAFGTTHFHKKSDFFPIAVFFVSLSQYDTIGLHQCLKNAQLKLFNVLYE